MKKLFSVALALTLVFTMSLSAFAFEYNGTEYPDFVFGYDTNKSFAEYGSSISKPYYFFHKASDTGEYELWFTKNPLYSDDGLKFYPTSTSSGAVRCRLENGLWSHYSSTTLDSNSPVATDLIYSSHDILSQDGTRVVVSGSNFPGPPLVEQVQKVTDQAMLEEAMEVTRTMGLLTVSGIGLMALLIGLALFGKRSLISLR